MHRLQWEPSQEKHVILYPEGMVELNDSSAAILMQCNGEQNFSEIVATLEDQFSTQGLREDIAQFLKTALEKNWVEIKS